MLISLVMILAVAAGGFAVTYVISDEESFMWRVAAGNIIGSAIFGTVGFVAACLLGFGPATIVASVIITLLPLLLLYRRDIAGRFRHDWAKAKGQLQGGNIKRFRSFAYYAFFFLLFWFFFERAMFELKDGIYTGGSQNLGDLPFHLGAIFGFTEGNNFPPQNPSWAGAKFSYPFIADFLTACLVKLGADVKDVMAVQNITWAFSLLVILQRFTTKLTSSRLAGRIAPTLLFFSGGLGFLWFFHDYWGSGKGLWDFVMHLPRDYTISDQFRWGNSMVVLFITQRSLLLGMPLTIMALQKLWEIFASDEGDEGESKKAKKGERGKVKKGKREKGILFTLSLFPFSTFILGLVVGTLPLIHLHSLGVLFIVTLFLFAFRWDKWNEWVAFGIGVALIAVPELAWSIKGSASETSQFIGWHFGWDKRDDNIIWFWIKNTGLVLPILAAGAYLVYSLRNHDEEKPAKKSFHLTPQHAKLLLLFYLPFLTLFVISNIAKMAPWEWDNIKVLIYWYAGSLPLIAYALAWTWQQSRVLKAAAVLCFLILIFAGALDVWRTASGQIRNRAFDRDAMQVAEQIKQRTAPDALFVNAPTYNSAVVLSGRRSLMRYTGHVSSHGINYEEREADIKSIYLGGAMTDTFLKKYDVDYVLVSPEEKSSLGARDDAFKKYPVIAESGQYRVYKVK